MGGKEVTFEEMVDLAIGTPGCAINFCVLKKLLKLLSRYCCKKDYTFEIDMDNLSVEAKVIAKKSRSSVSSNKSISQGSYESSDSKQTYTSGERSIKEEIKIKSEKDIKQEYDEEIGQIKVEKGSQVYSSGGEMYDSSSDIPKEHKQTETRDEKDSRKHDKVKEKKEKKHKKESDSHRKKDEESEKHRKKDEESEKHRKKSTDDARKKSSKKRKESHEDLSKLSDRSNELENRIAQLSDRIESITETMATHLNAEHLTEINTEIDKLKKTTEMTTDQCYETANSISDQSSQIQQILTTINDIQLRKVENEELIDLLSGKADYSFVDEKVSISQFDEKMQELKDIIGESAMQLDSVRLETNTSLEEIKQDLLTKLLAEEFDETKAKIYKELIKLTEQNALILAQQNDHVAAGAKMRNLNCFACDNDVVMLLEQEIIPKFRPLKASIPPLEPIIGSKALIDKNASEWNNHLLQTKRFSRISKASRFNSSGGYEKATYIKGRNGCMYKGNVGCDCMEASATRPCKCCGMVEANNIKNISLTNRLNSEPKVVTESVIGDVVNGSSKNNDHTGSQIISTNRTEEKLKSKEFETTPKVTVEVERPVETVETANSDNPIQIERTIEMVEEVNETTNVEDSGVIEIKEETTTTITIDNTVSHNEVAIVKTENEEPATKYEKTNNDTLQEGDGVAENQ